MFTPYFRNAWMTATTQPATKAIRMYMMAGGLDDCSSSAAIATAIMATIVCRNMQEL